MKPKQRSKTVGVLGSDTCDNDRNDKSYYIALLVNVSVGDIVVSCLVFGRLKLAGLKLQPGKCSLHRS